ncbi:ATP-binding cassette domain-containing protein [Nonomuraea ferruginea]|uniref:ATP-binding cassette domain-containing protein n=1 Tax=Nonomuraea ferruginea TaxID=46174 RepID=A0ABT4T9K3_9ACTN|nr:ATP-binding cassette domain-containing protein [Nonomuraea ferruginea]MDA0646193.1 ATP-binding cassette domain-containing protein [Nonomuraea ferruginea]
MRAQDRLVLDAVRRGGPWPAVLAGTAIGGAAAELALPYAIGRAVDALLATGPDRVFWLGLCVALVAAATLCESLGVWARGASVAHAASRLRLRVLRHVLGAGPLMTRRFPEGELVTRAGLNAEEVGRAPEAVTGALSLMVPTVGALVALVLIDPRLALALVGGVAVILVVLRAFLRASTAIAGGYQEAQGEIAGRLVDALDGARTIAAAGTAATEARRVLAPLPRLRAHGMDLWRANASSGVRAGLVVPLVEVAVLAAGGLLLAAGDLTVGELYAAARYAVLGASLSSALGYFGGLARARSAASRVNDILTTPTPSYGTRTLPEFPNGPPSPQTVNSPAEVPASSNGTPSPQTATSPAEVPASRDGTPSPEVAVSFAPAEVPTSLDGGFSSQGAGSCAPVEVPASSDGTSSPQVAASCAHAEAPASPEVAASAEVRASPEGELSPEGGVVSSSSTAGVPGPCGGQAAGSPRIPPVCSGRGTVEFRDVVVDGLAVPRLVIPGGSVTAVVGRSGSGKSLLAALAARLADPARGTVLLDGVPLPELTRAGLRRAVGYAFERPVLVGETVGEAIGPGPVQAAARAARADDFVRRLPSGYDTPLDAAPMSGGERQRLGLARAFARGERLLVLDDATSSLDTVTERQVSLALTADPRGRTRIVVAHRLATAARADQVVWLHDGAVRAVAPHHDLWPDPDYRAVFQGATP